MSMTPKYLTLLFLLGTSLLIGSQANADLIVNGSFEADASGTTVPTGWTVQTGDRIKNDTDGSTNTTLDGVGAQDGGNAFQLQDTGGTPRSSGLTSRKF